MARRQQQARAPRQLRRAVLVVGEGDAEGVLLRHLRTLVRGDRSTSITVRTGQGKGARGVVRYAIAQKAAADYDFALAVLDTDTDWDPEVQAMARAADIHVVPCQPCFEAVLRHAVLRRRPAVNTDAHKRAFEAHFGWPAHDERMQNWYERNWSTLAAFEEAAAGVVELMALLEYLRPPQS
jgi:hypothetical protein